MFNLFLTAIILFAAGCTTPAKQTDTVYDKASEAEKARFNSSAEVMTKLDACAEGTQGNDAQFTLKCAPLFNNKDIYVIFYDVKASGSTFSVHTENGKSGVFDCEVIGGKAIAKRLAALKKEDRIVISGTVKDYTRSTWRRKSSIPFAPDEESTGFKVTLADCKVK